MNWVKEKFKELKPKIKSIFRVKVGPEGHLWQNCSCGTVLYKQDLEDNLFVCSVCKKHHPITAKERFKIFFDNSYFQEIFPMLPVDDPLKFADTRIYKVRLDNVREQTKRHDSVMLAEGLINGIKVVAGIVDITFMDGSIGRAAGEAFLTGAEHALNHNLPYIFFCSGGDMRIQESTFSLIQASRMIAAISLLKEKKIPYIPVCLDQTNGMITGSIALIGDVNIAEPKAKVTFFSQKQIKENTRDILPIEFQTAEYLLEKGQIDLIVERKDLPKTISTLILIRTNQNKTFLSDATDYQSDFTGEASSFTS
jgi:acetyl-CoA carboxylase carboxyl transferase subunit beta